MEKSISVQTAERSRILLDAKDVTIIVPHLGADEQQCNSLDECLQSLTETTTSNIVLVKNGNQKCRHSRMAHISILKQGQCKAVNAAVATINTPWIFVTNDDMVYAPGWWGRLTDSIKDEACVSPQLVEPRPGASTFINYFLGGAGGDFNKEGWMKYAKEFPDGKGSRTGFNLPFLIKRDLWDTIGGYDINYDPWGSNSDSDLEYKIKLAGVQPYQNTNCVVYHFSQTSGTFHPDNQSFWNKNFAYFEEKWGFPRTDEGIWEATFEIPSPPVRKFTPDWEGKYA